MTPIHQDRHTYHDPEDHTLDPEQSRLDRLIDQADFLRDQRRDHPFELAPPPTSTNHRQPPPATTKRHPPPPAATMWCHAPPLHAGGRCSGTQLALADYSWR